ALGRPLGQGDDAAGAPAVAVVSHAFWRDALGADPAAVGRAVTVDGKPLTVVGVMPEGFDFPDAATALWRPFGAPPEATGRRGAGVAVRAARGARRRALARQLLAESLLVATIGGALGAGLAALALPPLRGLADAAGIPRAGSLALDGWVLAYSVAVSLAIGV